MELVLAAQRRQIGLDGGQRLAELVVQLMGEALGGGLLGFHQVPGDARQFGRLRLQAANQPAGHAHRERGEPERQQHAGRSEEHRAGNQPRRAPVDFGLRRTGLAVFGFHQPRHHRKKSFMVAEQLRRRERLRRVFGQNAAGFGGELERGLLQTLPQYTFGRPGAFRGDAVDVPIGRVELTENPLEIDRIGVARQNREHVAQAGLLAL